MGTEGSSAAPLEAVVLAAGSGSRFGGAKLLANWRGAPLLHGALAAAFAAPVRSVTLVIGAEADAIAEAARRFDVRLVHAEDHAEGMAASLRTGVAALPADAGGAFVFLGDMPRVPHAVLQPLADALAVGAPAAAPVFGGRRGNPVLLARALFAQVMRLRGDEGARAIIEGLGPSLARVESPDDGVLFDVDLRSDL